MANHFRLTLEPRPPAASVIALLRRYTGRSIAELREAAAGRAPFINAEPHHNQYTEFIETVSRLLDELEAQGIAYRVELDGRPETPELLRNTFRRWHDIGRELEAYDNLRFDNEPD